MNKHKDNIFAEKFRLLSSQGSAEDINWTSSESSEFENSITNADKVCSLSIKKPRKRKRKQKVRKNISNLDITFVDVCKDKKYAVHKNREDSQCLNEENNTSPILGKSVYFPPYKCKKEPTSPIISSTELIPQQKGEILLKSPILVLKTMSPKLSPKVRKKLFKKDLKFNENDVNKLQYRSKSTNICLNKGKSIAKSEYFENASKSYENNLKVDYLITNDNQDSNAHYKDRCGIKIENKLFNINTVESIEYLKDDENSENVCTIQETPELDNLDDSSAMLKTSSLELVKKVKTYFDNHFSSENASQLSISDAPTQKNSSKTSDDIEITNTITPVVSNRNSAESVKEEIDNNDVNKKEKKLRYKKDGLAYRLNNLLKKQGASVSLWQHERFLAANSDFVVPKGEFLAFRICKTHFKYGVCLLEAMDMNDDNFIIIINRNYASNSSMMSGTIFKLYEPYQFLDFKSNCKIIINVYKFECMNIDS